MRDFPAFDPQQFTTGTGTIHTYGVNPNEQILVYNDSPCGLLLIFADNSRAQIPAFWNEDFIITPPMGDISWSIEYILSNATEYPISRVYGTLYEKGEHVASVNTSMNRGIVVTNSGGLVTGATLVNTGSAPGTNIITLGSTAATGNTMNETSDGLLTLSVTIAAALVQYLKSQATDPILLLGAVSHLIEVLGNIKVDGTAVITGALTATNAGNTIAATSVPASGVTAGNLPSSVVVALASLASGNLPSGIDVPLAQLLSGNLPSGVSGAQATSWQVNGNKAIDNSQNVNDTMIVTQSTTGGVHFQTSTGVGIGYFDDVGNFHIEGNKDNINLYWPDGAKTSSIHGFSGSNSTSGVTVNHGFDKAPAMIETTINSGSSSGSATMGVGNVTATTCLVTSGAVLSGFRGLSSNYN